MYGFLLFVLFCGAAGLFIVWVVLLGKMESSFSKTWPFALLILASLCVIPMLQFNVKNDARGFDGSTDKSGFVESVPVNAKAEPVGVNVSLCGFRGMAADKGFFSDESRFFDGDEAEALEIAVKDLANRVGMNIGVYTNTAVRSKDERKQFCAELYGKAFPAATEDGFILYIDLTGRGAPSYLWTKGAEDVGKLFFSTNGERVLGVINTYFPFPKDIVQNGAAAYRKDMADGVAAILAELEKIYLADGREFHEDRLFSAADIAEINRVIKETSEKLWINICIYAGTEYRSEEEIEAFADEEYRKTFGEDADGLFYYVELVEYSYLHLNHSKAMRYGRLRNLPSGTLDSKSRSIFNTYPTGALLAEKGLLYYKEEIKKGILSFLSRLTALESFETPFFSPEEAAQLDRTVKDAAERLQMNVLVYASREARSDPDTEAFADDEYDRIFGDDTDGIFFYMDLSAQSPAYDYISTSGRAVVMYQRKIEGILDAPYTYLPSSSDIHAKGLALYKENFMRAVPAFLDKVVRIDKSFHPLLPRAYYYYSPITKKYVFYNAGKLYVTKSRPPLQKLLLLVLAEFIGLIFAIVLRVRVNGKVQQAWLRMRTKPDGSIYIVRKMRFSEKTDTYLHTTEKRTYNPPVSSSSSYHSGSSHRSSGGSHRSGGGTHGGGGRHR